MFKIIKLNTRVWRNFALNNISHYRNESTTTSTIVQQVPEEPTILVEKDTNITLIGINRERCRNSINTRTALKLCEALSQFEADAASPVAVLYGIGGSFCAGYDLQELDGQTDCGSLAFLLRFEGAAGPTRRHLRKPVVCGIDGYCVANGLELALLCDLRVMEHTAVLGFFNRRLGVPISDGGTVRLAKAVGYSRALDLITTGRRVAAAEALQIGLVNRLVATGTALGQAVTLAFAIAKFPLHSSQHDRDALYSSVYDGEGFDAAVQQEIITTSPEVQQEMRKGLERFKNSAVKGPKVNTWFIKEHSIPDWERSEIEHEKRYAKKKIS